VAGSKDFKLAFGVDISELASGLANAQAAVAEAAAGMRESLASVESAFGLVGEAIVGITSILAGGAAFKEMVESTVKLNVESMELGKQFGISATQASVLKVALGEAFLTQDQLAAAGSRITRTLNTNEGAFKSLGVATRDQNGNFRSTLDIMTDVNAKLLTLKEGTDRNVEGTRIYGRGWAEIAPILRLTAAGMAEAQHTAEELNLTVSKQSEASTAAYRGAMVGVKDVFEGIFNTIGDALLPALTSLASWFQSEGPAAIAITRAALATVATVFIEVWAGARTFAAYMTAGMQDAGIQVGQFVVAASNGMSLVADAFALAKDVVTGTVGVIVDTLLVMDEVARRAFTLDFSGAKTVWAAGTKGIVDEVNANFAKVKLDKNTLSADWSSIQAQWKEGDDEIAGIDAQFLKTVEKNREDAAAAIAKVNENIFGARQATEKPAATGTAAAGEDKNLMAKWEAQLSAQKLAYEQQQLAQGSFQEFSKQMELAYWQERLATHEAKGAQAVTIEKKIADLQLAINKQAFDTQLAGLKEQEAEYSKNAEVRIGIAKQEAQEIGKAYGTISPQYEAAMKHVTEVERQALEQQRQIAEVYAKADEERQLASIASDEKALQEKLNHYLISAKQFEDAETALENRRTAIEEAGVRARLALVDAQHDPVLYAQLNAQIEALETQHQARILQIQQKSDTQLQQLQKQVFTQLQDQFANTITSMMKGTETFGQGMKKMLQEVITDVVSFLTKWAVQWAETQALNMLSVKTATDATVPAQAAVAGASGVASWAGAPWPLDVGAPAFGAEMYAAAMGYMATTSAAGGYDIPAGISPVTRLHPREMVLPEDIATGMRSMIALGSSRGSSGGSVHISAVDAHSVERLLRNNPSQLAKVMRRLHDTGHRFR
jgi:hypothetical protein